ncbi:hypothetical protein L8949_41930, partial [Paraburkholderia caribensis]|nr:hypothetical protein [Paraburkholderia caribensis]
DVHSQGSVSKAGVRRNDGARYQPRLHDMRATFAVHRLTIWYQQGADVQRLLPLLSTYLGHASIAATQVYLPMSPELLVEASIRLNPSKSAALSAAPQTLVSPPAEPVAYLTELLTGAPNSA